MEATERVPTPPACTRERQDVLKSDGKPQTKEQTVKTRRCHPFYEITRPSILQLCKSLELPLFMNKAAAGSITRLAKEFMKSIQAFFPKLLLQ